MSHPLDNPVWQALCGAHRRFALRHGLAAHYARDVAVFSAVADDSAQAWRDLAHDLPHDAEVRLLLQRQAAMPAGWQQASRVPLLQMIATQPADVLPNAPAITALQETDGSAVAALIDLTRPGPFCARTMEMGHYLGVFDDGRLVAMAGERLRLDAYVELSAICTHPQARGRGLAEHLMRRLMRDAQARGQTPFLHVLPENLAAISLYRRLGFKTRIEIDYVGCRTAEPIERGSA